MMYGGKWRECACVSLPYLFPFCLGSLWTETHNVLPMRSYWAWPITSWVESSVLRQWFPNCELWLPREPWKSVRGATEFLWKTYHHLFRFSILVLLGWCFMHWPYPSRTYSQWYFRIWQVVFGPTCGDHMAVSPLPRPTLLKVGGGTPGGKAWLCSCLGPSTEAWYAEA